MKESAFCQILSDPSLWNPPVNPSTPGMASRRLGFIHPAAVARHVEAVTRAILLTRELPLCLISHERDHTHADSLQCHRYAPDLSSTHIVLEGPRSFHV